MKTLESYLFVAVLVACAADVETAEPAPVEDDPACALSSTHNCDAAMPIAWRCEPTYPDVDGCERRLGAFCCAEGVEP